MKNIFITITAVLIVLYSNCVFSQEWVQTNGPFGGSIRALCVSGTNLIAGTNGGVFYSSDNGTNWSVRNDGLTIISVNALAASGNTLYAAADGVFRSTDLGLSWTAVNSGLTNTDVQSLCISGSYVFAGTAAGVFRASTSGGNWTSVSSNALSSELVSSMTVSGSFVVAGTRQGGIYRTKNNGSTWAKTNTGLTNLSIRALYRSSSGNYLYAGGDGGVHRSTNNGKTWSVMNNGLVTSTNSIPVVQGLSGTGAKVYAGTSNGGVYYSSNRAANWTSTALQNSTYSMAVIGSNVFAGTSTSGVHHSTNNGTSWAQVNSGIIATIVLALATNGSDLFAGLSAIGSDVYRSTDHAATWTGTGIGRWPSMNMLFANGTYLFAGNSLGGLYRSTDNGVSWTMPGNIGPDIRTMAVSGNDLYAGVSNSCCLFRNGVHRSTDNGTSWVQINTGLTNTKVYALAVSGTNLFAGTYYGGVFLSTNNGANWSAVNSGLTNLSVIALAFSGSNLFAGTSSGGVFLSTNNGASWSAVNSGITNLNINGFAVHQSNVFVGTDNGIFLTTDDGSSWTDVGTGLSGSNNVYALVIKDTTLYAGTGGSGVWERPLSEMTALGKMASSNQGANDIPAHFGLDQNYPNPFNPSTKISWQSPVDGHQTLKVFDVLGNEVAVLVDEFRPAGRYEATFDASGLASGIYIYRLQAGDPSAGSGQSFIQMKKMILMK